MWKVQWGVNQEVVVDSAIDLDAKLDELGEVGHPLLVVVEAIENENSLAIGVGGELAVLSFVSGHLDPPYFTSLGAMDEDGSLVFDFMGAQSEFSMRNAISNNDARDAMREFVQSGERPSRITWGKD